MDRQEQIERLIEKTLGQFERPETLPPNPSLSARIQQHLESGKATRRTFPALVKPALLAALVCLNVLVAYWFLAGPEPYASTSTRQELIGLLAGDFNVSYEHTDLSINE